MKQKILLFWLFSSCSFYAISQTAIVPAGGDLNRQEGSISVSIGQIFYEPIGQSMIDLLPGVQQTHLQKVNTMVQMGSDIQMSVYPNPVEEFLNVEIEAAGGHNMTYQLFHINGQLQLEGMLEGRSMSIPVHQLLPGLYVLQVFIHPSEKFTFQIVKA
jgi:hypothetical protein